MSTCCSSAVAQDGDAVPHRHRLDLVVRHVDRRHAEPLLQRLDLAAHVHAKLRVEVRERLVHQEHLRLPDDRAAHGDTLALAAAQLLRAPVEQRVEAEQRAVSATRSVISLFGTLGSLRLKAMFCATVMCGYSA